MKSMVQNSHEFLKEVLHPQAIVIDATLGAGKDSAFFLQQSLSKLFCFEVDKTALEEGKQKIENVKAKRSKPVEVSVLHRSHDQMFPLLAEYQGKVDAIVFNFGWYPGDPARSHTTARTSALGVKQALELLRVKGRMALVFYSHEESNEEEIKVWEVLKEFEQSIDVLVLKHPFKPFAPWGCFIVKKSDKTV